MSTNCSSALVMDEKNATSPYTMSTSWSPDKSATVSLSSNSYAFCVTITGYDDSGRFGTEFTISNLITDVAQDCKSIGLAEVIPCLTKLFGFADQRCLRLLKALSERCISLFEGPVKDWYQGWPVLKSEIDLAYASYQMHDAQGSNGLANHDLMIAQKARDRAISLCAGCTKEKERIELAISEAFAEFLESVNPNSKTCQTDFYRLIDHTKQD